MDKYIGKKLDGRYEIRELIGVGGMANVYKAVMLGHNGPVPAVRRNYHHIPIAERVSLPLNLNRDVPLHKKIELIIVVCVRIHF